MSWVRIHDGALSHPKIVGMVDLRRPFDLWVWGLSYAQQHLTDGLVPDDAVPRIANKAAQELCRRGLWELRPDGYAIHDHLEWNDSRDVVTERKKNAKKRKQDWWDRRNGNDRRTEDGTAIKRVPNATGTLPITKPNQTKPSKKDPTASALSSRDEEFGRIFVHRWQKDSLISSLGPHSAGFDLDSWLFGLSALADSRGLVLPPGKVWTWVQAEFRAEVKRRELPMAQVQDEPELGKTSTRLLNAISQLRG